MQKKLYFSQTAQFFTLVALSGGIDAVEQFLSQDVIDWRSVAILAIGLIGIALRLKTKEPVSL